MQQNPRGSSLTLRVFAGEAGTLWGCSFAWGGGRWDDAPALGMEMYLSILCPAWILHVIHG